MIRTSRPRVLALHLVVLALLAVLATRVWFLEVRSGPAYAALANAERVREVIEPAVRGQITDDIGNPVVYSSPELVVSVSMPALWKQPDGGAAELTRLAALLGQPASLLRMETRPCAAGVKQPCWPGSPYQPIPVAERVPAQVALQVLEDSAGFPGVTAAVQPVSQYSQPLATDLAQVLGYLQPITASELKSSGLPATGFSGVDLVGQAGLQLSYDKALGGTPGDLKLAVNAAGQVTGTISDVKPKAGDHLVTNINAAVQHEAETALAAAVQRGQAPGDPASTGGAAVVLTTTGQVIAIASYPTYNPEIWTGGISDAEFNNLFGTGQGEPILDRAAQGQYAPGSTWKVTSVAAAVADGYSLGGTYNCPAAVTIGHRRYINDGSPSLGPMTFAQALVVSCDTVFYNLAYQMYLHDHPGQNTVTSPDAPAQKMQGMEVAWGFGKKTGIDLPAESSGGVPTREWLYWLWKDNAHTGQNWCKYGKANGTYVEQIEYEDCHYGNVWTAGQAVIASIGQGYVSVTPLQLANAYAALANGGTLYAPRIGKALISPSGKVVSQIDPPVTGHLPVSGQTLAYIRSALAGVVSHGTAAGAFANFPLGKVCVAGKTGTAEVAGTLSTSVFASFAPCDHPKFVVVMMVPNSGFGADVSAPAVRQIWDTIFGLEGHKTAFPGGNVPGLPHLNQAGQMVAPAGFGPTAAKHPKPAGSASGAPGGAAPGAAVGRTGTG